MQPYQDIEKEKKAYQAMDDIKAKIPQKSGEQTPKNCLGNNQPPRSVNALSLLSHGNDLQDSSSSSSNSIAPRLEDLDDKEFGYNMAVNTAGDFNRQESLPMHQVVADNGMKSPFVKAKSAPTESKT